jgi:CheY-like chemotaxis protein
MASAPAESPDISQLDQLNLENRQIIVVDDEVDSLELIQVILEEEGANVSSFSSPAKALEALAQSSFDLLISDIGMPNINGYDLMAKVRTEASVNRGIPAIALTAYAGERDERQAITAGYQAHVAKPIDIQELLTISSTLVEI